MLELYAIAFALCIIGVFPHAAIYNGQGFATEYYDIKETHVCGWSYDSSNQGNVACNPLSGLSLNEIGSNYLVAINNTLLHTNLSLYCGKKMVVSVNGVPSSLPFFIGDGCERCSIGPSSSTTWNSSAAPGGDFSHEALQELSGDACSAGHVEISWEVVDEEVYHFNDLTPSRVGTINHQPQTSSKIPTELVEDKFISYPATLSLTCADNAWKCNDNVLEQCIDSTWIPRVTCAIGTRCQGGSSPYCS